MDRTVVEKPPRDPMIRFQELQLSYNARRPINKLPLETLIEIFSAALTEWEDHPYLLLTLSQVCSHWRSVIAGNPLLYRSFSLAHPALTAQHLQRSLALPLDVHIREVKLTVHGIFAMMESIDTLVPHLERVRSLRVTSHSSMLSSRLLRILDRFPSRALTNLSLSLTRAEDRVSIKLPDLSTKRRTLRDLTTLSLRNMNISRAIPQSVARREGVTFRLRELELVFTFATPPTSATLVHLLARCPDLQTFTLRSEDPVPYEHGDDLNLPTSQLTKLKKFTYHAPSFKALVHILRHAKPDTSSMPQFDLAFPMSDTAIEALLCAPSAKSEYVHKLVKLGRPRTLRRLDVRSEGQRLYLLGSYTTLRTTAGPDFKLSIASDGTVGTPLEPSLAFWSLPLKDVSSVSVLSFKMHPDGAFAMPNSKAQWTSLLIKLHSLETLVLTGAWWVDVSKMFEALEPPSSPNTLRLCPKLATVELVDTTGYGALGMGDLTPKEALARLDRSKTFVILLRGTKSERPPSAL